MYVCMQWKINCRFAIYYVSFPKGSSEEKNKKGKYLLWKECGRDIISIYN